MDYLKLIAEREEELQKQMQVVENFSDEMRIVLKKGKLVHTQNLMLDFSREIHSSKREKQTQI